jgi:dTDP-4-dehydrorhamnose 3,5-epimerase
MALRTRSAKVASLGGVLLKPLLKHRDDRGWLTELFRGDELPAELQPAMGYLSRTEGGVVRGPHEHRQQTDCFCFLSGRFKLYLWDNRRASPTFGAFQTYLLGARRPMLVVIPPGVVHAYKNLSPKPGLVLNFPNRLYKGPGRGESVDEIRHEDDPLSPFRVP